MDIDSTTDEAFAGEADVGVLLGVLLYDDGLDADRILAEAAGLLRQRLRLGGVVQTNLAVSGRSKCAMNLIDLTSGEETAISQDLGDGASGCRLDAAALAQAIVGVERALRAGVDLLIINKFGKQEALGQGFRRVIGEALAAGVPVALGVARLNLDACLAFAGGPVVSLEPEPQAIAAWCLAAARGSVGEAL